MPVRLKTCPSEMAPQRNESELELCKNAFQYACRRIETRAGHCVNLRSCEMLYNLPIGAAKGVLCMAAAFCKHGRMTENFLTEVGKRAHDVIKNELRKIESCNESKEELGLLERKVEATENAAEDEVEPTSEASTGEGDQNEREVTIPEKARKRSAKELMSRAVTKDGASSTLAEEEAEEPPKKKKKKKKLLPQPKARPKGAQRSQPETSEGDTQLQMLPMALQTTINIHLSSHFEFNDNLMYLFKTTEMRDPNDHRMLRSTPSACRVVEVVFMTKESIATYFSEQVTNYIPEHVVHLGNGTNDAVVNAAMLILKLKQHKYVDAENGWGEITCEWTDHVERMKTVAGRYGDEPTYGKWMGCTRNDPTTNHDEQPRLQ